jgi:uncharacterized damage-inducible protein DinB
MTISEALLLEFAEEMASTRKILERVPDDKLMWKPHEKSFTLGRLVSHMVTIPIFAAVIINGQARKPSDAESKDELLESLDKNIAAGREAIAGASDDHFNEVIGGTAFAMPRVDLLRRRVMGHMIHHRGQLSVYLRLLDIPVPGMYGPSADEK